ncbi:3-oxo-tetronate 4-phosphate decarboxylase [Limibacillus sp. MBR-115]|jgi:ribulose-5-phosphate 4-epimerase/fuculose-1-phosphate aldolase|uniref:3-oxo-tetronate 4-phosphate decarboxylase n=1 Tax=Limibacillus sp. MBR-115 TaxID=3156465 RepID=UPI0033953E1E
MTESLLRERMAIFGKSLYDRGYLHGSSGNLSVRLEDGFLVTPTNSCLGFLDPGAIAKLDLSGRHLSGDKPSKEAFLHVSVYQARSNSQAVVHSHSTHSVALSCLQAADPTDLLPPITAYGVMKIGKLPLVPYYRPGDPALAAAVQETATDHSAVLLANHGPVVAGRSLEDAIWALEELEETAKLHFLLEGRPTRLLTAAQIGELNRVFPS